MPKQGQSLPLDGTLPRAEPSLPLSPRRWPQTGLICAWCAAPFFSATTLVGHIHRHRGCLQRGNPLLSLLPVSMHDAHVARRLTLPLRHPEEQAGTANRRRRADERRVGKECVRTRNYRWARDSIKKKKKQEINKGR